MLLRLLEATLKEEERRTASAFWFSDITECPRKVLLKRRGAEGFLPPPRRLLVRRLHGFAMEGAVARLLEGALPRTNRRTVAELLAEHPVLREDLAWGLSTGRLRPGDVLPHAVAQFPFRREIAGLEVHGRADWVLALWDHLALLEVKHVGPEGARKARRGQIPVGFLVQLGSYVHHLGLPGYLHVYTQDGEAHEFLFEPGPEDALLVDGRPATVGGLPPHRFAEGRLAALKGLEPEDFPIVEVAEREFRVQFPEGFPLHPDDRYGLVLTRKGEPRAEISRDGETVRAFRCPYCPARALCYPELPWREEE